MMADDMTDDARFMRQAIGLALQSPDNVARIGCVIVRDGTVIGEGHNEVAPQSDPTAHAEIVAIRRAAAGIGPDLRGSTLYSTLQPCGMCTLASVWAHVSRIVYSAGRDQVHRMYFEDGHLDTMDFIRDAYRDDLSLTGGVLAEQTVKLYHGPSEDVPVAEQANV